MKQQTKVPVSTKEIGGWARETDLNECPHWEERQWWELECNLPSVACQLADKPVHSWEQTQHELPLSWLWSGHHGDAAEVCMQGVGAAAM